MERHAQQRPANERSQFVQNFKSNYERYAQLNVVPDYKKCGYKEMMESTRPKLRGRYRRAYENLKSGLAGVFSAIHKVQSFVKFEKADLDKVTENSKAARLIQHRSYEYCYLLKAHILPISKHYKTNDSLFHGQVISTFYAAGQNSFQVAESLKAMWDEFEDPVAVCLDCKAWDGHVNQLQREQSDKFWNTTSGGNKLLKRLLERQSRNEASTTNLLKYVIWYVRCSGDFHTSDENSNINIIIIRTAFGEVKIRTKVMGDDSVVILESRDCNKALLDNVVQAFRDIGHDVKVDKICYNFQEIEFCQSSPIRVAGKWRMVRAPLRAISRARYTDFDWPNLQRYLTSLGLCELACNSGVPVLQQFAIYLLSKGAYQRPVAKVDREHAAVEDAISIRPITATARMDFEIAFNMSVAQQIAYEQLFAAKANFEFIERYKCFHKR